MGILKSRKILSFNSKVSSQKVKGNLTNEKFLRNVIGSKDIISWTEVSEIHKTRNGIYQRGGRLISLLTDFGRINPCYPDFQVNAQNTIFYTGAGRRGDQKLDSFNRAMFDAIETEHAVPLFNKLAVGRWKFLGFWHVTEGEYIFDETQKRMIWKFKIVKSEK